MKPKYLEFREIGQSASGKTKIINIINKGSDVVLGQIRWFSHWRKYTFSTSTDTIFDSVCLMEVVAELERLNREHKEEPTC